MEVIEKENLEGGADEGLSPLEEPLIPSDKVAAYNSDEHSENAGKESIRMVLICTFAAVCGSFEFGSCVGYSAPTQSSIRDELNLSLAEYSIFGSILTIGAMIGAITSGQIADYMGRKGAMRLSSAVCIAGWITIYLAEGSLLLDTGRFFTGYGIGIFSYVVLNKISQLAEQVPIFIAEIAPKNLRGGLTTLNQLMIVTGSSFAILTGTIVTWRTLALTGLVPCIALLMGLFFIPESPRWLAQVGLQKDFEAALRTLRGKDADISEESDEIQTYIETLQSLPKGKLMDLFESRYIRPIMIGVGLMLLQQFGGINGIGFYVSETFAMAGPSLAKIGTIAYAFIQVPITLVGAILMDKSGRRPLLVVSATGTCLGCFLTATSFLLKGNGFMPEVVPLVAVAGVLTYISFFSVGMGAIPWVIMSEFFSINVKGAAGSLVALVAWLGAWLVSFTFNFLMSWSSTGTFYVYTGFCALTILFVTKIVPETKGKTLEEIQASINASKDSP